MFHAQEIYFVRSLGGTGPWCFRGASLSPDRESKVPNMAVWGSIGALVGAGLGYIFFTDDPENKRTSKYDSSSSQTKGEDEHSRRRAYSKSRTNKFKKIQT